ncbi:MAG: hypothetical protein IPL79_17120 [Myxococcales bacterium]|nr:hypothetical protein [Myxococcales bacterium]
MLALTLALATAFALALGSCKLNEYCIDCPVEEDATPVDAPDDSADADAPDVCLTTGAEQCDGEDNDCDGSIDEDTAEEPLAQVGDVCSSNVGECSEGTYACENGALVCVGGTIPTPELCDNLDNDCDAFIDEGNPGGALVCGTDVGECIAGTTACVNGIIDCIGDVGSVGGTPEACDNRDNDCDGLVDEGLNGFGNCGLTDEGECALGNLTCTGGTPICIGAINPTFELCDNLDQDCDGFDTNGYNLNLDPLNCGTCGTVCVVPNAIAGCAGGLCAVAGCSANFYDIDLDPLNGCEYPCTYQGPNELCNLIDDDCDGTIDENLTPPPICETQGECAGAVPSCGVNGWTCNYGPTVSQDANGQIIPETTCDGLDNDCNGQTDEAFPDIGQACDDGTFGVCTSYGTWVCGPTGNSPLECDITIPGASESAEACDGLDNDCDNVVDDGAATGNLPGQNWVSIGNGVSMMKYEASRPDATSTLTGIRTTATCSRPDVLPWTNVTPPEAAAACASVGARLCTEVEWHRACAVVAGQTYPVAQPGSGNGDVVLEAENYYQAVAVTDPGDSKERRFLPDSAGGISGLMALKVSPNNGQSNTTAQAITQSTYVDYRITMAQTGNHFIWVRMLGTTDSDDAIYVGLKAGASPAFVAGDLLSIVDSRGSNQSTYFWYRAAAINVAGTGLHTLRIYMAEDGAKIDQVFLTKNTSTSFPAQRGLAPTRPRAKPATPTPTPARPIPTQAPPATRSSTIPTQALQAIRTISNPPPACRNAMRRGRMAASSISRATPKNGPRRGCQGSTPCVVARLTTPALAPAAPLTLRRPATALPSATSAFAAVADQHPPWRASSACAAGCPSGRASARAW